MGRKRVFKTLVVVTGGATSNVVAVREVLSLALRHDAVVIALAHNHPGGSVEPSEKDVTVTGHIQRGSKEIGVRFLDHVIIAEDQWRSLTASR
jgi:DNA repair protein RadC